MVYDTHKEWLKNIEDKKILDLGCLRGNALSLHMAKNAKEYIGIDLSDVAINSLQKRIEAEKCQNAKAVAVDFLSAEFKDTDFDIIYAYGVLHHFQDFNLLVNKLNEKLKKDGVIISYDPLETSTPIKIARTIYRPFQSDKDWEWPFTKNTFKKLQEKYTIIHKKGILGASKYGVLIDILPLSQSYKSKVINKRIQKDWQGDSLKDIYKCM